MLQEKQFRGGNWNVMVPAMTNLNEGLRHDAYHQSIPMEIHEKEISRTFFFKVTVILHNLFCFQLIINILIKLLIYCV